MSQARLDFSNGCLVMSPGSEGPSHDPYAYTEYTLRWYECKTIFKSHFNLGAVQ